MVSSNARFMRAALSCTLLLLTLLALMTTGNASAATTIGDSLSGNPYPGTSGMVLIQVRNSDGSLYAGSPVAGVLTSVSVKSSSTAGTVQVTFERQSSPFNTPTNFTGFTKFAENLAIPVPSTDPFGVITTAQTRIPILPGDRFGLEVDFSNANTYVLQVSASSGACGYSPFSSPVSAGTARNFYTAGGSCSYVPSVQGNVEPDADGDVYGDETQDLCPTDATRQTTCPAAAPAPIPALPANLVITSVKSKAKPGSAATRSFTVKNIGATAATPVNFALSASKKVKKFTFVKGCKAAKGGASCTIASLAPGASITIKVKVTPKASTSTKLTATVKTPGETATTDNSASTTVKFKLKK